MQMFLAVMLVFFMSYAHASEVSPCDLAHGSTWKVGLTTGKPGEVHVISHCKSVGFEALTALHAKDAAVVASWTSKVKDLDLSRSIYRYYFIVQNDHGTKLQIGLSEWKVSHAQHLSIMGNGIEIPPCITVALHFLSPGPPRFETSYVEISLPNEKGGWSVADIPRPMQLHVSSSSHFVRGEIRAHKIPKNHASSAACK